ncbi:MAG: M48 family peptidase [Actinomycetota bacterium]|nr:MAG: M48 family peptidase [Actinomycetota bacterium]
MPGHSVKSLLAGRQLRKFANQNESARKAPREPVEIVVKGISIELVRKEIKNLHLRVYPPEGRVRITAPNLLSTDAVVRVVEQRIKWIQAQRLKVAAGAAQPNYEDGEIHWFAGNRCRLSVVGTVGKPTVEYLQPGIIRLGIRRNSTCEDKRRLLEKWYREQMRIRAPILIELWEKRLGVELYEWRIRKMSTRWGSCNVRAKRIWLSLELIKKPNECLEYVVVHEIMHLLEPGHGPKFTARMDLALPNWRDLKRKLNTLDGIPGAC